ncbi:MAG: pyruvate formate lyase family protein [Bacteroidota bacterium]
MSTLTNMDCALLEQAGEYMAAGYMSHPDEPPLLRFSRALKRFYETCPLPEYGGEALYPCDAGLYASDQTMSFHYSQAMCFNHALLDSKIEGAGNPDVARALRQFRAEISDYPGVTGYTHSIINFGRILSEGLGGYRQRVLRLKREAEADDARSSRRPRAFCRETPVQFYEAMLILLEGIEILKRRSVALLRQSPQPNASRLADALDQAPFAPATGFYEAMAAINFLFYLDGSDDLGRFDQDLWPYYRDGLSTGAISREDARAWITQLFTNVDTCTAWNCAIGGSRADGTEGSNDLTLLCLEVARGRRRPNLALRLRKDTPDEVWDQALETISGGSGIPALYNEEGYLSAIQSADLGVAKEDLPWYAFGGCTELMVHGRSNVGSLDDTLNLAAVLERSLHRHLSSCDTFGSFLTLFRRDISAAVDELCERVNGYQESKARLQPQPIRTLLIDDCLDNAQEFNAGGARYNWSVINVAGLPNTYDSLAAVKQLVFECEKVGADDLLTALRDDFEGHEELRQRLSRCPHFGNSDPYVDELAEDIARHTFSEFMSHTPWRGGRYLASCLMFVTYGYFGEQVGATPDGRKARTPIGDSAGAVQGRDRSGPTAYLRSVARIPHSLAPGTLVINIRFTRRLFDDAEARQQLKALIRTYFDLGGMQLQVNVVDQRVLQDALAHPDQYQDLIIRMGGYSEYFNRLGRDLQLSVLERVEHEAG